MAKFGKKAKMEWLMGEWNGEPLSRKDAALLPEVTNELLLITRVNAPQEYPDGNLTYIGQHTNTLTDALINAMNDAKADNNYVPVKGLMIVLATLGYLAETPASPAFLQIADNLEFTLSETRKRTVDGQSVRAAVEVIKYWWTITGQLAPETPAFQSSPVSAEIGRSPVWPREAAIELTPGKLNYTRIVDPNTLDEETLSKARKASSPNALRAMLRVTDTFGSNKEVMSVADAVGNYLLEYYDIAMDSQDCSVSDKVLENAHVHLQCGWGLAQLEMASPGFQANYTHSDIAYALTQFDWAMGLVSPDELNIPHAVQLRQVGYYYARTDATPAELFRFVIRTS